MRPPAGQGWGRLDDIKLDKQVAYVGIRTSDLPHALHAIYSIELSGAPKTPSNEAWPRIAQFASFSEFTWEFREFEPSEQLLTHTQHKFIKSTFLCCEYKHIVLKL